MKGQDKKQLCQCEGGQKKKIDMSDLEVMLCITYLFPESTKF